MILEYLFVLKYKKYKNIDEFFLNDMNRFCDVTVKFKDRLFFYVKKKDTIVSKFILNIIQKYKCVMDLIDAKDNEYGILKYKLFKLFSKWYPEIILDTDFSNLIIVNIELNNIKGD